MFGSLIPVLPKMQEDSTIVMLATLLHRDALPVTLMRDPQWTTVKLGSRDRDGDLLWAKNMDEKKLNAQKTSYTLAGLLHVYYMEYFNEVRPAETQLFKPNYFQYATPINLADCHTAIYIDPAISDDRKADDSVICVCGMNMDGHIYVLDMWGKQGATPRETIDKYFELSERWDCREHGVESIGYQRALVHLLKEEMFRKNRYFEPVAVTHGRVKKGERIRGVLHPRFAAGYLYFRERWPYLESQLLDFGQPGVHDDWPDALAGAVALLDPFAAEAAGTTDLTEDEYPPLLEVVGGTYHHAP
jgi:hypothetical protein